MVMVHDFEDGFLPYQGAEVKRRFEELKARLRARPHPHPLATTSTRTTASSTELTWNTFRDQLILEYEIPKYDGDLGAPNLFVPLSTRLLPSKGRDAAALLPVAARAALVHPRPVSRGAARARDGVELAQRLRRGVLLPQGRGHGRFFVTKRKGGSVFAQQVGQAVLQASDVEQVLI